MVSIPTFPASFVEAGRARSRIAEVIARAVPPVAPGTPVTRLWSGSRRAWRRFSWRYAVTTEPVAYGLLRAAERSAAHMELRDAYTPDDPDWLDWQAGNRFDPEDRWASWSALIRT